MVHFIYNFPRRITLVDTQTHAQIHTDSLWPAILLAQPVELEAASCLSKLRKTDACITVMYAVVTY